MLGMFVLVSYLVRAAIEAFVGAIQILAFLCRVIKAATVAVTRAMVEPVE